ncbi:MAG: YkgJ family cysteine cluster protein [Kiritimatiellia bacterium]
MESERAQFFCQRCGACCRVPGYVRLTEADLVLLANELHLSTEDFVAQYTELSPHRTGLVLAGDFTAPCRFLTEDSLCSVHAARPAQCREYPTRWRSAEIEAVCAAMKERI